MELHLKYFIIRTLERFKLDKNYSCCLCHFHTEAVCHLLYPCVYMPDSFRMMFIITDRPINQKIELEVCFEGKDLIHYLLPPTSAALGKKSYSYKMMDRLQSLY